MEPADAGRVVTAGCESCSSVRGDVQIRSSQPVGAGWGRGIWPLVWGALFLVVPKCPLCLAAWMGALGVAGGGALHGGMRMGLAAAFVVALVGFAINAWRRRDVRPLFVAMLGGITAWVSQTVESDGILRAVSLLLLVVAALWNTMLLARIRRSTSHAHLVNAKPSRG